MSVIELEQQRTILIDAIGVAGQTALVHVNVMNARSIGRSPDISSRLFIDRIGEDGIQLIQDVIVGAGDIVGKNLARLDIYEVLGADEVKALEGGCLTAIVTMALMFGALVIG